MTRRHTDASGRGSKRVDHPDTLGRRTLEGFLWVGLNVGAQAVLQLVVLAVLARALTPQDFGIVSVALLVVGFGNMVGRLGIGPAIVQIEELRAEHLSVGLWISVGLSVVLMAAVGVAAGMIEHFFRMEGLASVLLAISLLFPLQGFSAVSAALLQRDLRFKALAVVDVLAYGLGYGAVGIGLALAGWGVWALVLAHVSLWIVKFIATLWLASPALRPRWSRAALNDVFRFGTGYTLIQVSNYFALQGDNLIVGRFLGASALGIYGRAYQFLVMPASLVGTVLDLILFPVMSRLQYRPVELKRVYLAGVNAVAVLSLPLTVATVMFADELIAVTLGHAWAEVVPPFQILALSLNFRTCYKLNDALIRSSGAVYRGAWRQAVYALAVVIGAWAGHLFGVAGVAAGTAGAVALYAWLSFQLITTLIGLTGHELLGAYRHGARLSIVTLVLVSVVKFVGESWGASAWWSLLGGGTLTVVVLLFASYRWPDYFLGGAGQWLVREVVTMLRPGIHEGPSAS